MRVNDLPRRDADGHAWERQKRETERYTDYDGDEREKERANEVEGEREMNMIHTSGT